MQTASMGADGSWITEPPYTVPATFTTELHLDSVRMNQQAKYQCQRS